jgi:hypothetical protein
LDACWTQARNHYGLTQLKWRLGVSNAGIFASNGPNTHSVEDNQAQQKYFLPLNSDLTILNWEINEFND